jgi:hypothetical protein
MDHLSLTSDATSVTATFGGRTVTANPMQSSIIKAHILRLLEELMEPKLVELRPSHPLHFLFLRTKLLAYDHSSTDEGQDYCMDIMIDSLEFRIRSSCQSARWTFNVLQASREVVNACEGDYPQYYPSVIQQIMETLGVSCDLLRDFLEYFQDISDLGGRSFREFPKPYFEK